MMLLSGITWPMGRPHHPMGSPRLPTQPSTPSQLSSPAPAPAGMPPRMGCPRACRINGNGRVPLAPNGPGSNQETAAAAWAARQHICKGLDLAELAACLSLMRSCRSSSGMNTLQASRGSPAGVCRSSRLQSSLTEMGGICPRRGWLPTSRRTCAQPPRCTSRSLRCSISTSVQPSRQLSAGIMRCHPAPYPKHTPQPNPHVVVPYAQRCKNFIYAACLQVAKPDFCLTPIKMSNHNPLVDRQFRS